MNGMKAINRSVTRKFTRNQALAFHKKPVPWNPHTIFRKLRLPFTFLLFIIRLSYLERLRLRWLCAGSVCVSIGALWQKIAG